MATNGRKFLQLTSTHTLTITGHALQRIFEYSGWPVCFESAEALFHRSRYTHYQDVFSLGYRPAYHRRRRAGTPTWYFRFALRGVELVAVLAQGNESGELVWVTTYAANEQTEHLRMPGHDRISAA